MSASVTSSFPIRDNTKSGGLHARQWNEVYYHTLCGVEPDNMRLSLFAVISNDAPTSY